MIKFLNDETVDGHRHGKGAIATFDAVTEAALIAQGDAITYPLPILISQSYSQVTRSSNNATDTGVVTLATVTVPGGTMNYNGKIVIEQDWKFTASVNEKRLRIEWGGVWVSGPYITNSATTSIAFFPVVVKNANSLSSQFLVDTTSNGYSTGGASQDVAMTADTTKNVNIDIRCSWGANVLSEQIILRGYSVWYYPGNT